MTEILEIVAKALTALVIMLALARLGGQQIPADDDALQPWLDAMYGGAKTEP